MDTERKSDNHLKAVNIHAAFIRQADSAFYFTLTQNSALIDCLYRYTECQGGYPEQFADFPLPHGGVISKF